MLLNGDVSDISSVGRVACSISAPHPLPIWRDEVGERLERSWGAVRTVAFAINGRERDEAGKKKRVPPFLRSADLFSVQGRGPTDAGFARFGRGCWSCWGRYSHFVYRVGQGRRPMSEQVRGPPVEERVWLVVPSLCCPSKAMASPYRAPRIILPSPDAPAGAARQPRRRATR